MIKLSMYSQEVLDIYRNYSDEGLEKFLSVSLQDIWEEVGESEEDYEYRLLWLIEGKLKEGE